MQYIDENLCIRHVWLGFLASLLKLFFPLPLGQLAAMEVRLGVDHQAVITLHGSRGNVERSFQPRAVRQ